MQRTLVNRPFIAVHTTILSRNADVIVADDIAVPVIFIPGVGGSTLAERNGSALNERFIGGFNPSNYQRLSLAPGEENDISSY
ncbi:MAG TPA: hypothetical protein VK468_03125 [Pyrinomonadaceae bacterium]|nr:hypothetical protein [Pyrinomonadaceae bacterium]